MTLVGAQYLADTQRDAGKLKKSLSLRRDTLPRLRRVYGDIHLQSLNCRVGLIRCLVDSERFDEARAEHESLFPVVRRVLGPDHRLTSWLLHPDFFTPQRYPLYHEDS